MLASAWAWGSAGDPPSPVTEAGLAAALGAKIGGRVGPDAFAWEPTRGVLADALLGRRLLFLGETPTGGPRDVYRAWVRVGHEGRPSSIRRLRNLTETPLGDEAGLLVSGSHASYVTLAYGTVQAVSLLRLDGDASLQAPWWSWTQRAVRALQSTGTLAGIGRTDLTFERSPAALEIVLEPPHVTLRGDEGRAEIRLALAPPSAAVPPPALPAGVQIVRDPVRREPLLHWAVDVARREVGPAPVAALEGLVFTASDLLRRGWHSLRGAHGGARLRELAQGTQAPPAPSRSGLPARVWPPASLPSIWEQREPGEGEWRAVDYSFLPPPVGAAGAGSPYFYRTFLRPDPRRPYSKLHLVAIDSRQLELRIQAGYEDPKPLTGARGSGRLPRDVATLDRLVATFNGAFKTAHGAYGMVVDRRVLLPPVSGAATVAIDEQGRAAFGTWPQGAAIPSSFVALRQNLEPLVVDGALNPSGREVWGEQLTGTSVQTQRTALCLAGGGQLYYAFGEAIDAVTLGRGLQQADCRYALHLDMNPGHCGFIFVDVLDAEQHRYELRRAVPEMQIPLDRYVQPSAKDFFYLLVRDLRPPPVAGAEWAPRRRGQPEPAFLPALFEARHAVGGVEVLLTSLAAERFQYVLRAGREEPRPLTAPPPRLELQGSDRDRWLLMLGLGATTHEHQLGLSFHHVPTLRFAEPGAALVFGGQGGLRLETELSSLELAQGEAAIQLPLLLEGGVVDPRANAPGPLRQRAALGLTSDGRVVLARTTHDTSAVLAESLLVAGCEVAVELERGAQLQPFLRVRGEEPETGSADYGGSVLYALDRPMAARGYRWTPDADAVAASPGSAATAASLPPPR